MNMGEKAGRGSLSFKQPETEKHPSYKGSFTAEKDIPAGTKLWLSGWDKDNNGPYISFNLEFSQQKTDSAAPSRSYADEKPATRTGAPVSPRSSDDMDDSIPFAAEFR
jgi:hypothetical protein